MNPTTQTILRFNKGELKRRASQYNILTNALKLTEHKDDFSDVHLITLNAHLKELAFEQVSNTVTSLENINKQVDELLFSGKVKAKEFVQIHNGEITVGINSKEIDNKAVNRAILLLTEIETFTSNNKIEFGKNITFHD